MNRQNANREIIKILSGYVEALPDWRFGQLLRNLNVIVEVRDNYWGPPHWMNHFNEESDKMLERVKDATKGLQLP